MEQKLGFKYSSHNNFLLEKRLFRIIEKKNIDIDCYINDLECGKQPLIELFEELTVNETYFFRENSSLELFTEKCEEYFKKDEDTKLKILCAGCSTGEESYSILLSLMLKGIDIDKIQLDCFDISEKAIEFAKRGKYKGRSIKNIKNFNVDKYFLNDGDSLVIKTKLRDKIHFFTFNMLDIDLLEKKYDIIFCRNLLIYFTKEKKEQVLKLIYEKLTKNGLLFMGKTETIDRKSNLFKGFFNGTSKYYVRQG